MWGLGGIQDSKNSVFPKLSLIETELEWKSLCE